MILIISGGISPSLGAQSAPVYFAGAFTGIKAAAGRNFPIEFIESENLIKNTSFRNEIQPAAAAVRMIFSAHGTKEDGLWAVRQARSMLSPMRPGRAPVVIWIENAYPAALPQNVRGLESLLGETAPSGKNWYEELAGDSMDPASSALLENIFRQAVSYENPAAAFQETQNPFFKKLREGIENLKHLGWEIRVEFEEPSFQAYRDDLSRDVMSLVTVHWLGRGQTGQALASLGLAYRYAAKSLETRDENSASQISGEGRRNSKAIHLVFRGLAHEKAMTDYFNRAKVSFRSIRQTPSPGLGPASIYPVPGKLNIHAYLVKFHELPSLDTPQGTGFLCAHLDETRRSLAL